MHAPSPSDFVIPLPKVGDFTFARRRIADSIAIRAIYLRLNAGNPGNAYPEFSEKGEPNPFEDAQIAYYASAVAVIKTLCVAAPAGWEDVEQIDIVEVEDAMTRLSELYSLLIEKEGSFRRIKNDSLQA